ncbi:MAG TPA: hypothetical protein VLM89_04295 [Phycisphaerae bacterium]|nr:hypothetical protein [Phycisphaerae bacterium]
MSFSWEELDHLRKQKWTLPIPPTCRKCSYILTGLPANRCPECGTTFKWAEVHRRAAKTWSAVNRLRHANKDARVGLQISLWAIGVLGVIHLLTLGKRFGLFSADNVLAAVLRTVTTIAAQVAPAIDFFAMLVAIVVIILGTQVFNIRRVPLSVRPYVGDPKPDLLLGTGTALTGLLLLVGSLVLVIL